MLESSVEFKEISLYGKRLFLTNDQCTLQEFPENIAVVRQEGLNSRKIKPTDTIVSVDGVKIGNGNLVIAAGPCAVESEDQTLEIAETVKKLGADMLRGGAFKPRTTPYSFQGLGKSGIKILKQAKEITGLPVVTELMDISDYEAFNDVDMIQIGSRNAQNFSLLKFLGSRNRPVLFKNGMANTITEWLSSAEYLLSGGNEKVVLCYRGTRGFDNATRFTMDSGTIPVLRERTHLPICADPSHPAGNRNYVEAIALASVAAGADMLEVEVHNDPGSALSDSKQQLTFEEFEKLVRNARKIAEMVRPRMRIEG
ncbi:MAG: 3-deoxy-7-phosphoheptulonate synthase [Cuniculiplasma sp.]